VRAIIGQPRLRSGFTLVELIVVVVIVSVLAAAIVPRLGGQRLRSAKAEVRAVRDFLSAVAVRSSLVVQNLAVVGATGDFTLYSPRALNDPADFSAERPWITDLTVPPVRLNELVVVAVTSNGDPLATSDFTVVLPAGAARPSVGVVLSLPDRSLSWRIELPPGVLSASVFETDRNDDATVRSSTRIDLDDSGMGDTPW